MGKDAPRIEFSATQEIIVKLKEVQKSQRLTIPQIKAKVDATGAIISMTTIRRVFAEGSETEDSFNYDATIRPIAQALLIADSLDSGDDAVRAKVESIEAIIRLKNDVIESQRQQIEGLKAEQDRRCREYEKRMDFLRDQIELKDQRMDRKDDMIEKLLAKLL